MFTVIIITNSDDEIAAQVYARDFAEALSLVEDKANLIGYGVKAVKGVTRTPLGKADE